MLQRLKQTFGDQLGAGLHRDVLGDHDELVAAETPERVGAANDAVQPGSDRTQELISDAVTERVVDALEVVQVDEQRGDRSLGAGRAREHLLDAVKDQRAVRQARQGVVRGKERELLATAAELLVGAPALGLEALAHPHQAELQAQLQDVQGLGEDVA